MKQYEKPVLEILNLVSDTAMAFDISQGDNEVFDDEESQE